MKKVYLVSFLMILGISLNAQTTILDDWEGGPSGNRDMDYWTGNSGGYPFSVENPNKSGVNTSDTVAQFNKESGNAWVLIAMQSKPWEGFDLATEHNFYMDVYSADSFRVRVTLKDVSGAGTDLESIDGIYGLADRNSWKTLNFDFSSWSAYTPADRVELQVFFGAGTPDTLTVWFDNIIAQGPLAVKEGNDNSSFSLNQNAPNPASDVTSISYEVKEAGYVELVVTDILGNTVATLVAEDKVPGTYTETLDVSSLSPGMYIYSMTSNGKIASRRLVVE